MDQRPAPSYPTIPPRCSLSAAPVALESRRHEGCSSLPPARPSRQPARRTPIRLRRVDAAFARSYGTKVHVFCRSTFRASILQMATKTQRRTIGAVVSIALGDGTHCYAQVLPDADFAFFDVRAEADLKVDQIVSQPVLFRVAVMNYAVTSGRWKKVGKAPLAAELQDPIPKFIEDALDPSKFEIYVGGNIRPATRNECHGLERAAVWDPEHVEERLRDHYAHRPNRWLESLRIKPEPKA